LYFWHDRHTKTQMSFGLSMLAWMICSKYFIGLWYHISTVHQAIYTVLSGIERHDLKLRHLLRFITGCYSLPPLGLPDSIKIKFLHGFIMAASVVQQCQHANCSSGFQFMQLHFRKWKSWWYLPCWKVLGLATCKLLY
jgi:hypothetical protein